jgi:predicted DCC family thiol-disulfide oxidoreductase YuxK
MSWLRQRWNHFWFEPSEPTNIGLARITFFGLLVVIYFGRDSSLWATIPDVFWMPIAVFRVLSVPVVSSDALGWLDRIWMVSLALSCVGFMTRGSTTVSFALGTYLLGLPHNFGKTHHSDTLIVLILGIMAVSRCGDAWSVDRLLRLARGKGNFGGEGPPRRDAEYTWPIRLVWALMAATFFSAGLSKLRYSGLQWILSENMRFLLIRHQYTHVPLVDWGPKLAQYHLLTQLLAVGSVALELGAPLAVFSRRLRLLIVPGLMLMQAGIWTVLGVSFLPYFATYVFWVPWDSMTKWLAVRLRRKERFVVLFDGACGVCRRATSVMRTLNLLQGAEFVDVVSQWPAIHARFPELSQEACLRDMHVVRPSGKVMKGYEGYRALAAVLPLTWPVLPLLYAPGIGYAGRRIYRAVASNRLRDGCDLAER